MRFVYAQFIMILLVSGSVASTFTTATFSATPGHSTTHLQTARTTQGPSTTHVQTPHTTQTSSSTHVQTVQTTKRPSTTHVQTLHTTKKASTSTHGQTAPSTQGVTHTVHTTRSTTHAPTSTTPGTTIGTTQPHNTCNHGRFYHDSHAHMCYKVFHHPQTWHDAEKICEHMGATLAAVGNDKKWEGLKAVLHADPNITNSWIYIGGHDHDDNEFRWVGTNHRIHYNNWAPGQPDAHTPDEDCLAVAPSWDSNLWYDVDCGTPLPFVCTVQ